MKKYLLIGSALFCLLEGIFLYQYITFNDKKLHIVVCDVGQGDAIFMRTPDGSDILIDGGPDDSVLACLGRHMPFWDKTIEIMMMTHPDADHSTGLIDVLKRYVVMRFYTSEIPVKTAVYFRLLKTLNEASVKLNYIWQGDKFVFKDGLIMTALWPTHELADRNQASGGNMSTNSFSVIELLTYKNFKALLTGDAEAEQMDQASSLAGNIGFLKVPHHGSKTGLTAEILDVLNPKIAGISVGAKNKYGLPSPFVLDLLKSKNIQTLRTDQVGDIEVVSDGKTFSVN